MFRASASGLAFGVVEKYQGPCEQWFRRNVQLAAKSIAAPI